MKTLKWNIAQTLELQWWKQYLQKKDVNEYLRWKRGQWDRALAIIRTAIPIEKGMKVLDAGCGPAGIFMNLTDCAVDAVDPLVDQYEKELPHFKRNMYPHVRFFNSPVEDFTTSTLYDVVISTNAINHVSDIAGSYKKLSSMVRPGGTLVITVDAHNHQFFKHLYRLIPGDMLHPHQYDVDEYIGFFTRNGFSLLLQQSMRKEFFFSHFILIGKNDAPASQ
jgi:2-polyprenyl-3-methyl-5-hydroxy-6-metoxy-1,4-benzoquinol methylase